MDKTLYHKILNEFAEDHPFDVEDFAIDCDESNFDSVSELKQYLIQNWEKGELNGMEELKRAEDEWVYEKDPPLHDWERYFQNFGTMDGY